MGFLVRQKLAQYRPLLVIRAIGQLLLEAFDVLLCNEPLHWSLPFGPAAESASPTRYYHAAEARSRLSERRSGHSAGAQQLRKIPYGGSELEV